MKTIVNLSFLFVSLLLLSHFQCCAECGGGSRGLFPVWKTAGSGRVLLLIPEEFQRFVYVSTYEGDEIRHPLGEEAVRELRAAFGIEFASVEVWPVGAKPRLWRCSLPEIRSTRSCRHMIMW